MRATIVVHGGAGEWGDGVSRGEDGVSRAAEVGYELLRNGGSALDAVERAVVEMEDNPVFNAGLGSALNLLGEVEMDAAVMEGNSLRAGSVAIVTFPKNPVRLARLVMERTAHVTLAGKGADEFAKMMKLDTRDPRTQDRLEQWRSGLQEALTDPLRRSICTQFQRSLGGIHDTVGALAIDSSGNLAVATSTGGTFMKLPGRIGDTPMIGAGCYADDRVGAATVTGIGEIAVRLVISKEICDQMRTGRRSSQNAVENALRLLTERESARMGAIAIDRHGGVGAAQISRHMPWAYQSAGMKKPRTKPKAKIIHARRR